MKKVKQMFNQILDLLGDIKELNALAISIKKTKTEFLTDMPLHDKIVKDMASQLQSERERNKNLTASLDIAKNDYEKLQDRHNSLYKLNEELLTASWKCHYAMMQPMVVPDNEDIKIVVTRPIGEWLKAREEAQGLFYSVMEKASEKYGVELKNLDEEGVWLFTKGVWNHHSKKHNYSSGGLVGPQKEGGEPIKYEVKDHAFDAFRHALYPHKGPKAGEGGIKEVFVVDVPSEKLREDRLLKTIEELKEENSNYEKMLKVVKNDFDSLQKKYNKLYMLDRELLHRPESEKIRLLEAELKVKTGSQTIYRLQQLNEKRAEDIVHLTKTLKTAREDFNVLENRYERLEKMKDEAVKALEACFGLMMQIGSVGMKTSIAIASPSINEWLQARARAEELYYLVMEPINQQKEQEDGLKAREEVTKQREGPRPGETVQGWANRMRGNSDVVDNKTNY